MTHEEDNPKPEETDSSSNPPREKSPDSGSEPERFPDPPPRTFGTSQKHKKERKFPGVWGILFFFCLIVAAGIGGAGFFLYQEHVKFKTEVLARFTQLDDQLNALDTEADLTRKNQQAIEALKQEIQQFKTQVEATLKSHQNALTTLDEDVLRLKEKVNKPPEALPAPPAPSEEKKTGPEPPQQEISPQPGKPQDGAEMAPEEESERSEESQKFIDWVENFFAAIWDWLTGLFS